MVGASNTVYTEFGLKFSVSIHRKRIIFVNCQLNFCNLQGECTSLDLSVALIGRNEFYDSYNTIKHLFSSREKHHLHRLTKFYY